MRIRSAKPEDFAEIWTFLKPIIRAGETYPYDPELNFEEAKETWFASNKRVYVLELNGQICGSYYIRANQECLGAHVANAGFMVAPNMQGQGIGRALGEHALEEAKRLGYTAMQFNLVVSSNIASVKLWQKLGFEIIATLPKAFKHLKQGMVDAYIMFREL